eukprot:998803_1
MLQSPADLQQLQTRIQHDFPQFFELPTELAGYFEDHQFDDFKDIVDDIAKGYDECCCKEKLFEQLKIIKQDQKRDLYDRLKRCLEPIAIITPYAPADPSPIPTNPILNVAFQNNFVEAFSREFDQKHVQDIWTLFEMVVQEQYEDIESIKEDVEDEENSEIINDIFDKLDYNSFQKAHDTVKNVITRHIRLVIDDAYQSSAKRPTLPHSDPTAKVTIEYITKQISTHFAAHYKDKAFGEKIASLFRETVDNEGFEVDTIHDDLDDIQDSVIVPCVIDGIKHDLIDVNNFNSLQPEARIPKMNEEIESIESRIKAIVEGQTNVQEMGRRVIRYFTQTRDTNIATIVWNQLCSIMIQNDFTFDDALKDIRNRHQNKSKLVNGLNINEVSSKDIQDVIRIIKTIKPLISELDFNITEEDVQKTAAICFKHCPFMYEHIIGMAKEFKESDLESYDEDDVRNKISGKALCIVKAIDIKNRLPWLYWLLHIFSRQRWGKYRKGEEDGLNADNGKQMLYYKEQEKLKMTDRYDIHKHWWEEHKYMKWICSTKSRGIAERIRSALEELAKRTLPAINCNYSLAPIICDSVNDYALYALGFHDLVNHIKELMERDLCECKKNRLNEWKECTCEYEQKREWDVAPLQLDCVILPQMTREAPSGKSPIKLSGYKTKVSEKPVYCKLSEEPTNVDKFCIWKIEDLLRHKKCGYFENRDYFVTNAPDLDDTNALRLCLFGLLEKCIAESARTGDKRRNRYIFIIDRRNPQNLKDRTLKQKPIIGEAQHEQKTQQKDWADKIYIIIPKRYRDEEGNPLCICGGRLTKTKRNASMRNTKCCWCDETEGNTIWKCSNHKTDKTYVLCSDGCEKERPEPYGKISSEWHILPESCLGLSKGNILFNPYTEGSIPITMNDALSGYMFGLSYHVLSLNNICAYWYHNTGGTVFQLNDIATGWPQWFDKINGKKQALSDSICRKIAMRNALPNTDLEGFEREIDKCDEWECPPSDS